MKVYSLIVENTVAAGGPMGGHCYTLWTKLFKTIKAAKEYAQNWHNKKSENKEILEWYKHKGSGLISSHCGWVEYYIDKKEVVE